MALVTIQRSPSPSTDNDGAESSEDASDARSQIRKSLSESYFTVKGAALILPHNECTRKTTKKSHGGEMQHHLQAMLHILRPEDTIKIAIRLEDVVSNYHRYMALVSTRGRQDTEECVILGLDCGSTGASVGLVLPVWLGLKMKLGGDGGFSLYTDEHSYLFKPVSVQAMWSAIQSLVKVVNMAESMKYIHDGLSHTWVGYYRSRINHADQARQGQWNIEGIEVFAPSSLAIKSDEASFPTDIPSGMRTLNTTCGISEDSSEKEVIKLTISQRLKEVMMVVDLDEATSIGLRRAVEQKMGISLTEYKKYFDEEVMRILGQMDEPSEILDFLFLGSEWNASNLEEIKSKGIGYILNVTKEIDNFFMGMLQYYNVRLMDVEESDLLKHWDKTYKFICKARSNHSKVLVHCKMGISRSASTVMAFLMKDRRWSVDEAFKFVKSKRSIVRPNDGFMEQLNMYEGILTASNKRDIFRSKSDQNLLDEANTKEEGETVQGSFLGDSLFHVMSHSDWPMAASGGVAYEEEWIADLQAGRGMTPELMQMEGDLEAAEARSADSMDDVVPEEIKVPVPSSTSQTQMSKEIPASDSGQASVRSRDNDQAFSSVEREEKSGSVPMSADGSNGEDNNGGSRISASSRNIKPDSSWIRPASLDLGYDVGESSTDEVGTNGGSQSVPCTPATGVEIALPVADVHQHQCRASQSSTTLGGSLILQGVTESESTDTPMQVDTQQIRGKPHSKLAEPCPVSTAPCETSSEHNDTKLDSKTDLHKEAELVHHTTTAEPESAIGGESKSNLMSSTQQNLESHNENTSSAKSAGPQDPTSSSPKSTESDNDAGSKPRIEMGVRQYFFREKIPWSPGKVKKMREDINKTGHIQMEEDMTDGETARYEASDGLNTDEVSQKERQLLPSLQRGMSQSHSCVELGSAVAGHTSDTTCSTGLEPDSEGLSLYEKEEIPLEPGTVLRTRREIEERHRFLVGGAEDDEEEREHHPVLRTSSLKQDRSVPTECVGKSKRWSEGVPGNSRFSSGGKRRSLDELRLVGSKELESLHGIEALKTSMTKQRSADISNVHVETKSESINEEPQSPRPKGNLDTDTLALIREIGSALLMSPTSSSPPSGTIDGSCAENTSESESCSNMVKYFVRKIELQQRPPSMPESPSEDIGFDGVLPAGAEIPATGNAVGESLLSRNSESRFLNETRQDSLLSKPLSMFSTSGDHKFVHVIGDSEVPSSIGECKASSEIAVGLQDPASVFVTKKETCNSESICQNTAQSASAGDSELLMVESPDPLPQEEDSPTVKHLVDKFESSQAADILDGSSPLGVEDCKANSLLSGQLKGSLVQNSSLSSPKAQHKSATPSSLPGPQLETSATFSLPGSSHETATTHAPAHPSNRNMPDCNIPVELYELPSSSPPGLASQQQKRMATSPETSPRSLIRSLGPQPFSKQSLARMSSEGRSWRPVRPKSTSDRPGSHGPSLYQRSGSADFGEGLQGKTEGGSIDVTFRHGGGEEGRKKRRLHGKSLPVPSAFEAGEQHSQQPQQKLKLGQGPFYSSM